MKSQLEQIGIRVQVVLGETIMTLEDFSALAPGKIVALDSIAGVPVDLVAEGRKIGKGEVVVIDENFGIRVTELDSGE